MVIQYFSLGDTKAPPNLSGIVAPYPPKASIQVSAVISGP